MDKDGLIWTIEDESSESGFSNERMPVKKKAFIIALILAAGIAIATGSAIALDSYIDDGCNFEYPKRIELSRIDQYGSVLEAQGIRLGLGFTNPDGTDGGRADLPAGGYVSVVEEGMCYTSSQAQKVNEVLANK